MAIIEADAEPQTPFEQDVAATQRYFDSPRFDGIIRLYSARQVVEQRGTIPTDYTVAREAADGVLRRACASCSPQRKSITTFGPYSPGQAVAMKRMGIEGIYLGGWATSRQGVHQRGPGARPRQLSAEPGARRGRRAGARAAHRRPQPAVPAPADDRRAARRDPGVRLPAVHHRRRRHRPRRRSARAQPDPPLRRGRRARATTSRTSARARRSAATRAARCWSRRTSRSSGSTPPASSSTSCGVPGIIVARTDAEAANLIDSRADERDQPFLLGATNLKIPSYKACFLAMMRQLLRLGRRRSSTAICSTRCPTASTPPPTPGWSATASLALIAEAAAGLAATTADAVGRRPLRQGRIAVRRRLAGGRRAADLRRGGRRGARIPRAARAKRST